MLVEEKMLKVNQLSFGKNIMVPIRDGKLFILIPMQVNKLRDLEKTSDSTLADHSTSDPDFQ